MQDLKRSLDGEHNNNREQSRRLRCDLVGYFRLENLRLEISLVRLEEIDNLVVPELARLKIDMVSWGGLCPNWLA